MAWLYLGRARLGLGETRGAIEALQQAVVCRPEFADPHLYLAEALAAEGKTDEAIRHARNAEKLARPDDARPRQLLERLTSKGGSGK
jgi:tetratricopeptide (TPR) repeat protein